MYVAFPVIKEADEAKVAEVIYTDYDPEQEHYLLMATSDGREHQPGKFRFVKLQPG